MTPKFEVVEVKDIIRRTKESVSIVFNRKNEGSWIYKPGQYLTLRTIIEKQDVRRAYSISSNPYSDEFISVTVKEVKNGIFSSFINNKLKVGDKLELMPPMGKFTTEINETNELNYIFWAGGSGITPIFSLINSILLKEKKSNITLIYANKNKDSIIFFEELTKLASANSNFVIIHILEESSDIQSLNGLLDFNKCKSIIKDEAILSSIHFLCGPIPMMRIIEDFLISNSIDSKKIHKESFTLSENQENKNTISLSSSNISETKEVEIRIYGEKHKIKVKASETILQAAIKQHLDPPFSCQIAACATCQAKVISGNVEMEADDALTQDEIEDGIILTCVSHPKTDDVIIDYDF